MGNFIPAFTNDQPFMQVIRIDPLYLPDGFSDGQENLLRKKPTKSKYEYHRNNKPDHQQLEFEQCWETK